MWRVIAFDLYQPHKTSHFPPFFMIFFASSYRIQGFKNDHQITRNEKYSLKIYYRILNNSKFVSINELKWDQVRKPGIEKNPQKLGTIFFYLTHPFPKNIYGCIEGSKLKIFLLINSTRCLVEEVKDEKLIPLFQHLVDGYSYKLWGEWAVKVEETDMEATQEVKEEPLDDFLVEHQPVHLNNSTNQFKVIIPLLFSSSGG